MSEASEQMSYARKAVRLAVKDRGEYDISYMHKVAIVALNETAMSKCIIDSMALHAARDVFFAKPRKQAMLQQAFAVIKS